MTAVTLAIQTLCAIIAYDNNATDTTCLVRGRARKPPANKRIYDTAPISKLRMCKIGNWVQNTITETMEKAANLFSKEQFHNLYCDSH